MPVWRLEGEQLRAFQGFGRSAGLWRSQWTWAPLLFLRFPAQLSSLSGIFVLETLDPERAHWVRVGGGTPAGVSYERGSGNTVKLWSTLADAAVETSFSLFDLVENPGESWTQLVSHDKAAPEDDAAPGKEKQSFDDEAMSQPLQGKFVMPRYEGRLIINIRGQQGEVVGRCVLLKQPGLFWEGMPVYRSDLKLDPNRDTTDKWVVSMGGAWVYGEVPKGSTFEELRSKGFFDIDGEYKDSWKAFSDMHSGEGPQDLDWVGRRHVEE